MFARGRVVIILNAVVTAAGDVLCDHSPLVAKTLEQSEDHALFIVTDGALIDNRVQMVVPSSIKEHVVKNSSRILSNSLPFTALFA